MRNQLMTNLSVKAQEIAPDVLVVVGVGGLIYSTIKVYKTKTKAEEILKETRTVLEQIEEVRDKTDGEVYSEREYRTDIASSYFKAGVGIVKAFAIPVSFGVLSIGCIFKSHGMLKDRNAALTAAYAVANESYKLYKDRVIEKIGEEAEKELRYGVHTEEVEEVETDEEGNENIVKKERAVITQSSNVSPYAKFFDEYCDAWAKDPEHNLVFLKAQERYANDRLRDKGILYLNEVYKMLGLPPTKAGQIVGWVYDEENPVGDNFVDFGIYDLYNEAKRAFVNGHERSILLDFNVDGNVWQLMRD